MSPSKEDVGQTLGTYGFGPGCYLVLPILGPSTARDTLGILADTYIDPFAHVTLREKEIFSTSGNALDYYSIKATGVVDFRADNIKNFESLVDYEKLVVGKAEKFLSDNHSEETAKIFRDLISDRHGIDLKEPESPSDKSPTYAVGAVGGGE